MTSPTNSDWRLQGQEKYLAGVALIRRVYSAPRPDWDHDHCEFCSTKFMIGGGADTLQEGYCTLDAHRRWICKACFNDFHVRFGWRLEADGADV
jgi:hypothetical protein